MYHMDKKLVQTGLTWTVLAVILAWVGVSVYVFKK